MINTKLFLTLFCIAAMSAVSMNYNNISEGFWGVSVPRTTRVDREVHSKRGSYSLMKNVNSTAGHSKFVKYPTYQGNVAPRFSNVDYGASLRTRLPERKYRGAPKTPLGHHNCGCDKRCVGHCKKEAYRKPCVSSNKSTYPKPSSMLPVKQSLGGGGSLDQPIVYDRYIVANQKSRLRAQGCPFRGDLAIPRTPNTGWFQTSANPSIDLREGAMNVMGGVGNENSRKLAQLIYNTSGGHDDISSGVPLPQSMVTQFNTQLGGPGRSDVHITAYP